MEATVKEVKEFWEGNPLFSGESEHQPGSKPFFDEHRKVYLEDCFAGSFPEQFIPENLADKKVLDLGCGVGFWTVEIQKRRPGCEMYAGDLTENALKIAEKRLSIYGLEANLSLQNAENLTYQDETFDHVNCQGVIHHTPNTEAAVTEIARVLKPKGTASVSVYYQNFFVRNWKSLSRIGKILTSFGGGLKGRGRETMFNVKDTDELTRLYDGEGNPIGKSYSKSDFKELVEPYFEVEDSAVYFFPARALPIAIPKFAHRFLADNFGFMIHLNLIKR